MSIHWSVIIAAELTALIVGTYYFKNIKQKFLYLYLFVVVGVCTDIFLTILIKLGFHNLWVSHIYFPLEFILIALFYKSHLSPVLKQRWIILIIFIIVLYSLFNVAFIQELHERSNLRPLSSLILVAFSLLYFYCIMIESRIGKLTAEPMIWINSAILFFFATLLFYNMLITPALHRSIKLARKIGYINRLSVVIFYLVIAYSFYLEGRKLVIDKRVHKE